MKSPTTTRDGPQTRRKLVGWTSPTISSLATHFPDKPLASKYACVFNFNVAENAVEHNKVPENTMTWITFACIYVNLILCRCCCLVPPCEVGVGTLWCICGRTYGVTWKKNNVDPIIFQHTPGTYPRPPTNSLWRNPFHLGVWGGLEYAARVCWGYRVEIPCIKLT